MIEQDYSFSCPYCGVELSVRLDASGGRRQQFVQDCETCCKPIQIEVRFDGKEVTYFSADADDYQIIDLRFSISGTVLETPLN